MTLDPPLGDDARNFAAEITTVAKEFADACRLSRAGTLTAEEAWLSVRHCRTELARLYSEMDTVQALAMAAYAEGTRPAQVAG